MENNNMTVDFAIGGGTTTDGYVSYPSEYFK